MEIPKKPSYWSRLRKRRGSGPFLTGFNAVALQSNKRPMAPLPRRDERVSVSDGPAQSSGFHPSRLALQPVNFDLSLPLNSSNDDRLEGVQLNSKRLRVSDDDYDELQNSRKRQRMDPREESDSERAFKKEQAELNRVHELQKLRIQTESMVAVERLKIEKAIQLARLKRREKYKAASRESHVQKLKLEIELARLRRERRHRS
ncbi:hypothetical protein SISNIDRAFT_452398 [Sistotremastrum niveocremeum HHB9708]|uniref:Uncharacterized protein n=1 Tax=Sistotremastrum niveocremeum HHB9708 TaxID=1314777 RepID=A0A164WIU6_9AGAM|nr:hypothetical protein SISNIDRAFT_452398 [Sistotremastrum niveocremeum HHB9708]